MDWKMKYGTMYVDKFAAEIRSVELVEGQIEVMATFGPGISHIFDSSSAVTLQGVDGLPVHNVASMFTRQIELYIGDTLDVIVRMKPVVNGPVDRWVLA